MTTLTPPARFAGLDLTPAAVVERARGLHELLRSQQDEAEDLGRYTQEVHEALLAGGFYHLLTPKRYGGLEADLATFAKVVIEISAGDPGSGWCYCLGHGHNLTTASGWPVEAQDEVFNNPLGYFRASQSLPPSGTAKRVEGGLLINARSPYQSGVPYATHATVLVLLEDAGSEQPTFLNVLVPADKFQILPDWGGDATLGMRASGSNTVLVENEIVPEYYATVSDFLQVQEQSTSAGYKLHGNPIYLGVAQTFLLTELVAVVIGAARAALDEYETIIRQRKTILPPQILRVEDPQHQRDFGHARVLTDSAETIVLACAQRYLEHSATAVSGGQPFTRKMDIELFGQILQAGDMASQAVELLFRSAGSSAAKRGERMQRYMRDVQTYRGHNVAQFDPIVQRIGAVHLGQAKSIY